jgi:UDP-N-acetylmuramyl pentapeptide phosphotransferase/UDP-N-acetylglucosamine-1-phosphate transferase
MLIAFLIGISVLLSFLFAVSLWPPWRSHDPSVAWLLFVLAVAAGVFDLFVLLATLQIRVNPLLALFVLVGQDAAMVWRLLAVRRTRRSRRVREGKDPSS